jgi:hypothetical protein
MAALASPVSYSWPHSIEKIVRIMLSLSYCKQTYLSQKRSHKVLPTVFLFKSKILILKTCDEKSKKPVFVPK